MSHIAESRTHILCFIGVQFVSGNQVSCQCSVTIATGSVKGIPSAIFLQICRQKQHNINNITLSVNVTVLLPPTHSHSYIHAAHMHTCTISHSIVVVLLLGITSILLHQVVKELSSSVSGSTLEAVQSAILHTGTHRQQHMTN